MSKLIYIDLDGVIFDFEGHYLSLFGHTCSSVSDKVMWQNINNHGQFFRTLPLFPHAAELLEYTRVMGFYHILTACPIHNFEEIASQKRDALRAHFPTKEMQILFVPGGKNKYLYMHRPRDLLIDDNERNCRVWTENGGNAVHYHNMTKAELWSAIERAYAK